MAPTRKAKSVNKRYSSIYEVSPDKDAGNYNKSKPKKKLADKLGSQWSKSEIERFYKAYREYGKDWKKVAAAVRNRSAEMAEALYIMNRAYLSLPDGTASVIGLIAMMTDHYSMLGGSDCERESNEPSEIPQNAQKRRRAKVHLDSSKDVFQPQPIASSQGCLSLLRKEGLVGIHPHAVRKRTPRVSVPYSYRRDDIESYTPPNKRVKNSEVDGNDDEHVAALTLTGALQRGGSPQVSQTPYKGAKRLMEGRPGGTEPGLETYVRDTGHLRDMEVVGTIDLHQKGKKFSQKKVKVEEIKNSLSDNEGEACSGTEEGVRGTAPKGKGDMEISSAKREQISPGSYRKRSNKKLVFGDESTSIDALLALANLSTSIMESESSVKLKEDRSTVESDDKSSVPEAASISHHGDKIKYLGPKEKVRNSISGVEDATLRKSKVGRYSTTEGIAVSETKKQPEPTSNSWKRKRISSSSKISNAEASMDHHEDTVELEGENKYLTKVKSGAQSSLDSRQRKGSYHGRELKGARVLEDYPTNDGPILAGSDSVVSTSEVLQDMAEEENKYLTKGKSGGQSSAQSRPGKGAFHRRQSKGSRVLEDYPTNDNLKLAGIDSVVSTSEVPTPSSVSLPTKHVSRWKMNLKRALNSADKYSSKHTSKNQPNELSPMQDRLKEKLFTCLSSNLARRWCTFEWFYSAIDYAWFAKREFVEYLHHVGLGHIPRLTRVEWGVIRSSLGKPRRFSERFLQEERQKLKQYRESVRQHYAQLRIGTREGLPTDLARPLSVGQRVIAIHPETREVHDGKVLTVDHDRCRVQFDSPELGVEFVMDIDCMPLNPLENMPEALRRQNLTFDKFSMTPKVSHVNGEPDFGGSMVFASRGCMENATSAVNMLANQIKVDENHNILHAKAAGRNIVNTHEVGYVQPISMAHIQGREADIRVMSELTSALDRKEALLMELRHSNNDILKNQSGESCLKDYEPFKKHVAMVLVQLKEASDQASSALLNMRQQNAYSANPLSPWQKPPNNSNLFGGLTSVDSSIVLPELGSAVGEVVKGSRQKAHIMVETAIKAISYTKDGEDAYMRIKEALDSVDKRQFTSDIKMPVLKSTEQENGSFSCHNHSVSSTSNPVPTDWTLNPKLQEASNKNEEQFPSELITSCVATLLMIQTCTERQYPPGDVAQIIDSAVTSLHPSCPQNLPIYREIQMCMGRIKTQILALIPT